MKPSALFDIINIINMTSSPIGVRNIKYIMYNVENYSVLYNAAVRLVICEGWHFIHMPERIISLRGREVWVHRLV